jgi:MFS family permease
MAVILFGLFAAAVVNGTTVGILWASSNQYIADSSSEENKGFFFSYFWSFYMASQIFGNLIAAFVLGYMQKNNYFEIMACVAAVATISFFFLRKPDLSH